MNRKGEVDFLVHCFKRFARRPVRRVLDIACGTGPHLVRLAERGYRHGRARSLRAATSSSWASGWPTRGSAGDLVVGDMTDFRLTRPVDAAICMQDSQGHLLTNDQLLAHLRSVARNLRRGRALRLRPLHGLVVDQPGALVVVVAAPGRAHRPRLVLGAERRRIPVSQVFREHMTLEAVENGTRRVYRQTHLSRMVFPQELRGLVELAGGFEFVQWFFGFKPHQVLERSRHPLLMVVVLRKR